MSLLAKLKHAVLYFVVKAFRVRDGDWVRFAGQFDSERLAWEWVTVFWVLMVLSQDYVTVNVVRTIAL